MSPNWRDFDETKYISSLIKDDELLEKYDKIWEKVKNGVKWCNGVKWKISKS